MPILLKRLQSKILPFINIPYSKGEISLDIILQSHLPQFVKNYLFDLCHKQRKETTIKRYIYDLEDFFTWLSIEKQDQSFATWAGITPYDLEKFVAILTNERNYKPRTTNRVLTVLNQLYKYYDNLGLSKNPIQKINMIEMEEPRMTPSDFLTIGEVERLFSTIYSSHGLSENQLKSRAQIVDRNAAIIILFLYYGLTLQQLITIKMTGVNFVTNMMTVQTEETTRLLQLEPQHKQTLYNYFSTIPLPIRPRFHENDPFFVAFDFQRGTYRWLYEDDKPKPLTNIAVQRMIQKEVKRSGLKKGISAQHFRNTFILMEIEKGKTIDELQKELGLKSNVSLKKYYQYFKKVTYIQKAP